MPEGLVRTDLNTTGTSFKDGDPVTEPKNFGTPVTEPKNFGNTEPQSNATFRSNPVDWTPDPKHFGNIIGPVAPPPPPPPPPVVLSVIQSGSNYAQEDANPMTLVLTSPVTAGNSLYVCVGVDSLTNASVSVADNLGVNTYSLVSGPDDDGVATITRLYKCENVIGTPQSIIVTFDVVTFAVVSAVEINRTVSFPTIDHFAYASTTGINWTGPSVAAPDNSVLIAFGASEEGANAAPQPGTGWMMENVLVLNDPNNDTGFAFTESQAVTTAGTYPSSANSIGLNGGMYNISIK